MRRTLAATLAALVAMAAVALTPGTSTAEDWPEYGYHGIAFKIEYVDFAETVMKSRDVENGIMVGFEGYRRLSQGLYLSGEASVVTIEGTPTPGVNTDLNYMPLEVNVRYVGEGAPSTYFDVGGGVSYSYVSEKNVLSNNSDTSDWVLGGQVFAALNYVTDRYYGGITTKYQITQNYGDPTSGGTRFNLNNWRLGVQAGMSF